MITSLVALKFAFSASYDENLNKLISLVDACEEGTFIVAPEVVFSGFDYDNFEKAAAFSGYALEKLSLHVEDKTLIYTTIEKDGKDFYNYAKVLHHGKLIYSQAKAKLFTFGGEHNYFKAGDSDAITLFEIEGVKIAILICFELRFKSLWKQVEGADIICVPAYWGKNRVKHYKTLTNALAIMNQCYVIASDANAEDTGGAGGVITPFGNEYRNENEEIIAKKYMSKEIEKMRRYMNVGI